MTEPATGDRQDILNRAAASDEFLAERAEAISWESTKASRVKFDGATERYINNKDTELIKTRVAICREMYENVGIIGNVIDLMVDFALEGFTISHPNKSVEKFYENWAKETKLYDTVGQILKCLYRDGNVPIMSFRSKMDEQTTRDFKKTISDTDEKRGLSESADNKGDRIIPTSYAVLDVLKLNVTGSDLLGTIQYDYQISTEEKDALARPSTPVDTKKAEQLKTKLGQDDYRLLIENGVMRLDPSRLTLLYYKKDSFKRWCNPMLWRVVDDVKFKKLLRDMDISVAESVCNALTFIKLGKVAEGFPAPAAKYTKLANMLKNPSKSKIIIWDDLVDIKSDYPPVERILGAEKYKQVNDDIRSGLGIAEILVNGQGGNYSNSFLSVKTLLERLETGRNTIMSWVDMQIMAVARGMGFRKPAKVRLDKMSLTDETAEKQIILELYDRNIISARTVAERMEEDIDVEIPRMTEEDEFRKTVKKTTPFVLLKTGKFGPQHINGVIPIGREAPDPTAAKEAGTPKSSPTAQGPAGDGGGRPVGTPKSQTVKRNTAPKGQKPKSKSSDEFNIDSITVPENLLKLGPDIYDCVFESLSQIESISDDIESQTIKIMSLLESGKDVPSQIQEFIKNPEFFTSAPAKLERCVREVTQKKVQDFKAKHGRAPNKDEKKDIISSSWAICRSSLDM